MLEIFKENGVYSLTRVIVALNYVLFIIGTAYLILTGTTWGNYEVFCVVTATGGAATQIANKFLNSKYNSEIGKPIKGLN